jgi:hypothetical protein
MENEISISPAIVTGVDPEQVVQSIPEPKSKPRRRRKTKPKTKKIKLVKYGAYNGYIRGEVYDLPEKEADYLLSLKRGGGRVFKQVD